MCANVARKYSREYAREVIRKWEKEYVQTCKDLVYKVSMRGSNELERKYGRKVATI